MAAARSSLALMSIVVVASLALLVGLGTWQLQRLAWKEALIARIETRLSNVPVPLPTSLTDETNFLRVKVRGTYDHAKAQYFYTLNKGEIGWRVLAPFQPDVGAPFMVDRGYVPDPQKPLAQAGQSAPVEVVGAVRLDYLPQVLFTPDNDPSANSWYWFDLAAVRKATGLSELRPFVVQLDTSDHSGQWPAAAPLSPNLSNKHFGYALTWFGLAITLLGVYIALIIQERRKRSSKHD
ncbi:MAG: SURF1 family protein [Pseudomonadota bacterium]